MTIKNFFGGAIINYGEALPDPAGTPDGALFFKTGTASGLYIFSFTKDSDAGTFGDQSTQGWTQLVSTGSGINADTLDGLDSSAFQLADAGLTSLGGLGTNGFVARTGPDTFATRTFSAGTGITFTPGAGDGSANISIGVNQSSLTLGSIGGTLPISKGGTGSALGSVSLGGVTYANSTSTMAVSAAGTAPSGSGINTTYHVLFSNGSGAPSWVNALSSLNVAYATSAGSATTATTAGSASTATTATNVAWTGITGLPGAQQSYTNTPATNFTTLVSPSYFYRMLSGSGATSLTPGQFFSGTLSGFESLDSTNDIGNQDVGITITGTGGSGSRSAQISVNWNYEELAPQNLRFRVNDTSGTIASWGAWRTVWDQGNLTNVSQLTNDANYLTSADLSNYVTKTGSNTITGDLTSTARFIAAAGTALAPSIAFSGDLDTGIFSPGGNSIALVTAATERLRFSSAGAWGLAGANYGTAGQVLASNGSGSAPTWQSVSSLVDSSYVNVTGDTMTGILTISNTTASTTTSTGALVVSGGVGVGGALYVNGNINTLNNFVAAGALDVNATTASTSTTTGAAVITGGVGIGGALNVGGAVNAVGNVISSTKIVSADGSAAAPSYTFSTDTNTGFYCAPGNANELYVATAGAERAAFTSAGLGVTGAVTATTRLEAPIIRLTGTSDASLASTGHAFQIGVDTGVNLIIDTNEIQGRNNGAESSVNINIEGGDVTLGNITAGSTIRFNGTALRTNPAGTSANLEVGWRQIPITTYTSGTLTAQAVGACVPATAAVTVPANVFATGDAVTIYNDTGSNVTITQGSGLTMYGPAAATGNRTLEPRGICTIWFRSATVCKISGEVS